MLNSVSETSRRRFSRDDRRRQLLGIGLTKLMEKPIQDLSLDEIAQEAGISRGLLFHYFPTKTDFYFECIAAAGRRILRNVTAEEDEPPDAQVRTLVRLMVEQVDRRREFYLSLVHGVPDPRVTDVYESVRAGLTDRVMAALDVPAGSRDVVHAWWAYVEDRALAWSADVPPRRSISKEELVARCHAALDALLALG
jgi:AcrR family transcriptional regulator